MRLSLCFLLLSLSLPALAQERPGEHLLDAIDIRLNPENLQAMGVDQAMASRILLDETQSRYRRVRAMSALCILGGEGLRQKLLDRLQDRDAELRIQAVIHFVRRFGPEDPQGVEHQLRAFKSEEKPLLRMIDDELKRLKQRLKQQAKESLENSSDRP